MTFILPVFATCASNVVPVHKRSSKAAACGYQPVSLLSVMSKVMVTIINKQLMNNLDRHELLTTRQYGFRKGLGTADLLTALHHEWATTISRGGLVRVLAIDIAGAFDRVSHADLLHEVESMGIAGQLLTWLTDYLSGRRLQVVVGGQHSATFPIRAGVPQGSILGPTLFYCTSTMPNAVSPPTHDLPFMQMTLLCTP